MISYLGDLVEDAMDSSWQGVKAAHPVPIMQNVEGVLELGGY